MVIPDPSSLENLFQGGGMVLGGRRGLRKAAVTLLSMILILSMIQPTLAQEPGRDFESAPEIDLSTGSASLRGSLTGEFEDNHYYKLVGLSSGVKVRVSAELLGTGTTSGLTTIVLYSEKGARLVGSDQTLGKGARIHRELTYTLGWNPENPNPILYLRIGKSRGALNYTIEISVERVDDAGSGIDAGIDPSQALEAPKASLGEPATFTGYLAGEHLGDDHVDCYMLKAILEPRQTLKITVKPSKTMRLKASLLSFIDKFPLRNNESKARGMPITLQVKGDWLPGTNNFYLTIDNMDGRGGEGSYTVKVEVLKPINETATITAITTAPGIISEEQLKYVLIGVAVALVAIAAIILVLRRRRGVRVVEAGEEWWGGGWEETW